MQSRRRTFKVTAGADMRREGEIEGDELGPGRGTGGQTRRDGAPVGTGRQSGGGYHYRQQLPAPSSCSLGPYPGPVANNKQQQVPLGNKDLIIRMLAEIFQVRQDECGQVRWHQVSTSLVPISLYSRTTSKWLDYLLTAPLSIQANDPANTMSPDSRDFLLLLQQFHQQTSSNRPTGGAANSGSLQHQQLRNSSSINTGGGLGRTQKQQQQQVANLRGQDAIVFQVIGHDFIDGQCRKILNVKIRQPGTRLGQASDYFVYWKDQSLPTTSNSILTGQPNSHSQHGYNLHHQQYSASSYASNASIMQQASSMKPPPNAQMLNPPQLVHSSSQLAYDRQQQQQQQFQSSHYQHQHQHQHQPTWGLNFASMNDAKLFYDICSLNIVNLDFNSEYLKQLTINDCGVGGGIGKQRLTSSNSQKLQQFAAMSPSSQMLDPTGTNQRIMPRNSRILNQQQQQQQQQRLIRNKTSLRMLKQDTTNHASTTGNSTSRSPGGRQASISRCPSCKQNFVTEDNMAQSTAINNNKDEGAHLASHQHSCPVHGQHQQQQAPPGGGAIRARSRSTTRQALGARGGAGGSGGLGDPENLARARSFSTPASPEPNQCPVHRRRHRANTECELEARDRQHQQQQLDYLKRGGRQGSKQTAAKLAAAQKEGGPEKPARGFLRSSYLLGSQEEAFGGGGHQRRQQQQQGAGSINQIAQQQHHGGTQYNMDGPTSDRLLHVKPSTKTRYMGYLHNVAQQQQQQQLHAAGQYYRVENPSGPPFELDANGLAPMSDRSLFRRMQTGTETFDTFAHRDARLARAQYANSRNMKEFLSLDAGGLKSSTSFQLEQQQRFQQHRKHMRQQTTATTTTNGESKNNNGNQPGQAEVYANFGAAHQAAGKSSTTGGTSRLLPVRPGAGSKGGGGGQAAGNEEQQRGAPSGQPLIQCNVSTTTEDLPMDSSTRKRMLKLTSEEIISEHTEPRSVSTSMAAVEQMPNTSSNQSQPVRQSRESAELPPVRAVSLGPELAGGGDDNRVRGREARSDVGRRRSLERSGCVDLELSLPASSFKKKERLSPLPQSSTATSPQQEAEPDKASLGNGSPEPPARGSSRTVAAVADSEPIDQVALDEAHLLRQADEEEEEEADQIYGMGHYTQQPKGALPPPAPQESSRRPEYHNRETNNLSLLYAQSRAGVTLPYITQEMRTDDANEHSMFAVRSQQLASFKSAPDMRRLNEGEQTYGVASSRILRPMDYAVCNDDDGTTAFLEQQHCFAVEPNKRPASKLAGGGGRSNLSSYAVPLCTTVKRPPLPAGVSQQTFATRRQCHSCPNSLRRKRRPSSANSDQPFYTHEPLAMASGGECSDLEAMAYHHHHHHLHHMPPPKTPRTHIDNCCSFKRSQQQQQTGYPSPYQDHDHDHLYHQEPMQHGAMHACCDNINGRLHPGPIECPECLHGAGGGDHGCHLKAVSSKHQQQQLLESHWRHHRALHHYHHHGAHPYHQQPPPAVGANARAVKYDAFMRDDMQMHHHGPPSAGLHQAGSRTGGDDSLRRSQPGAAAASMRPHSSQSVRSPMQYGLYESDCDEGGGGGEDYDNDDDDEDISSPARPTLQQFYGSSDYYYHHYNSGQNTSSKPTAAGRPTGALSAATFVMKPVQGYDQTMSRACLKSRQRSRSQPPGGTGDNYDHGDGEEGKGDIGEQRSAQHLTKSMENVEKLIREVQNELRALKRQPLGAAQIDMKPATAAPTTGTNRTNNAGATPEAIEGGRKQQHQRAVLEMAQEQDEAEGRGRQPLQDNNNKQLSYTSATRRAGQFKCVGAIRKAGFLSVKKWILKRRQSIELARKQGWRRYWVCLRGTALLFHSVIETKSGQQHSNQQQQDQNQNSSSQRLIDLSTWIRANCSSQLNVMAGLLKSETNQEGLSQEEFLSSMSQCYIEEEPRHLIIIDGAIAQPIPEHPRRDFVFCLSTTFGDAYLFQASCQLESDNWISAIHNACAASIARDLVRDEAIKLFETKIRHFELEAEKKLFLRHRLESRLTSMSSMCNMGKQVLEQQVAKLDPETSSGPPAAQKLDSASKLGGANSSSTIATTNNNRKTMRSLLYQLSQQLMALDSYIEQLHCEIYQLRCYLSSCSAQNIFYHNLLASQAGSGGAMGLTPSSLTTSQSHDLPHPKTLLMHVSKPTKLLLIKLGVFTVPSFHAFIHARQESAKSILDTIQQQSSCPESPIVELRIRSRSISETLMSRPENVQLAKETETLIELANLKTIPIVLSRELFNKIRGCSRDAAGSVGVGAHQQQQQQLKQQQVSTSSTNMELDTSDDRCSIEQCGQFIKLNVKLNSSSNSSSIIKQVLRILEPNCNELDFLNYYLRLATITTAAKSDESTTNTTMREEEDYFVVKRKETLEDWSNYAHIEMLEKVVFRVELTRSRMDEDDSSVPFGICVEGQLLSSRNESLLNVYCSYIEWGSVADKAGLQDEDEFLMINGCPVGELDLMFVECIIQEATKLRAVIRTNRSQCPAKGKRLNKTSWRSLDDDDDDQNDDADGNRRTTQAQGDATVQGARLAPGQSSFVASQVITDEYLTSLVCPPPPTKSSAFLRTDTNLLRQKSDLGLERVRGRGFNNNDDDDDDDEEDEGDNRQLKKMAQSGSVVAPNSIGGLPKSRSQHRIDVTAMNEQTIGEQQEGQTCVGMIQAAAAAPALRSSAELARQLMQKTERITRLLGRGGVVEPVIGGPGLVEPAPDRNLSASSCGIVPEVSLASLNSQKSATLTTATTADHNHVERLKKSVLELIETEYAYVRHLETINDHYMSPLCETSFLNIFDLGAFSQTCLALLRFQRGFFSLLTRGIFEQINAQTMDVNHKQQQPKQVAMISDDFERFNWIVQRADSFECVEKFKPILASIASAFTSEADKFKIYASYCVAYSKLQRILHPKTNVAGGGASTNFHGASSTTTIISIPNSLNTFAAGSPGSTSNIGAIGTALTGGSSSQHRDLKLFNLIGGGSSSSSAPNGKLDEEARTSQFKQLTEFLANLDSSSSSASFSLQRSSLSEQRHQRQAKLDLISKASSSDGSNEQNERLPTGSTATNNAPQQAQPYQKSAHHQNFESYLIKPIQRIVKYPMLLNSIALVLQGESSATNQSSYYNDLQTAIKHFETVINHVNESQRVHDEYGTLFDHIERQFFEQQALDSCKNTTVANLFGPHQPPITLNIAKLLYSGPVAWLNVADFTSSKVKKTMSLSSMLFVFESCVVFICKEQIRVAGKKKLPQLKGANENQTNQTTSQQQSQQQQSSGGLTSRVLQWSTGVHSSGASGSNSNSSEQLNEIVRYQTLIPVSEVQVRSVSSDNGGKKQTTTTGNNKKSTTNDDNKQMGQAQQFNWELFQCSSSNSNSGLLTKTSAANKQQKQQQSQQQQQPQQQSQLLQHRNSNTGKVYLLASPSNEERSAFLRKIRFTIRESVRNMSLPTVASTKSSSSNKSLALKKLSTSSASSATSNTNINTSGSLSPPESSGGPDLMTQDQSTTIKCEPYNTKKVHETSIEVQT